jgi:hypothetical protein
MTDTVQLVGVKDGVETVLGTATMPPKMKARELVREMFGAWAPNDGSDSDLAYAVCESLIDWMGKNPPTFNVTAPAPIASDKIAPKHRSDEMQTVEQAWDFWRPIICNDDGSINMEQLKLELCDASNFMGFAACVYEHATGGQCTKVNTLPSVVKALIDDHVTEVCEGEQKAESMEWREHVLRAHAKLSSAMTAHHVARTVLESEAMEALEAALSCWEATHA